MKQKQIILSNSTGKAIVLPKEHKRRCELLERKLKNDLGYNISVTTLTEVLAKVSEQKYFEVPVADYVPVKVGTGAWSDRILQYRSQALADDFATGIINTSSSKGKLASADAGIEAISNPIYNWAKDISWTLFDVRLASRSGNWDIVEQKEKARKKNWDLGIQGVGFLGLAGDSNIKGLMNQSGVTVDTVTITAPLSSLASDIMMAKVSAMLAAYRINCNKTTWPNRLTIPESDYLGLAVPSSSASPNKSKLQIIEETLKILTKNPNFQVLPLVYGDSAYNGSLGQTYALYNADEDSMYMAVPVDYTNTAQNTENGFHFTNVAYGQFGGVFLNRTAEFMYFRY